MSAMEMDGWMDGWVGHCMIGRPHEIKKYTAKDRVRDPGKKRVFPLKGQTEHGREIVLTEREREREKDILLILDRGDHNLPGRGIYQTGMGWS